MSRRGPPRCLYSLPVLDTCRWGGSAVGCLANDDFLPDGGPSRDVDSSGSAPACAFVQRSAVRRRGPVSTRSTVPTAQERGAPRWYLLRGKKGRAVGRPPLERDQRGRHEPRYPRATQLHAGAARQSAMKCRVDCLNISGGCRRCHYLIFARQRFAAWWFART